MSIRISVAFVLAALTIAYSPPIFAQVVQHGVYASVLDKAGAPVVGLTASDFAVHEDGVAREVIRVSPDRDPMQVAVLIDTSEAVRADLVDLRQGLRALVRDTQGRHEVALIGFGGRTSILADYTRDANRLDAAISRLVAMPGSGSYLLQAIIETSKGFRGRKSPRPVIVALTAEGPEFSEISYQIPLDYLRENSVTLHSFVLGGSGLSPHDDAAQELELTLAQGTMMSGGRRENLSSSMTLTARLQALAAELNNQYLVVYARQARLIPPKRIEVTVKRPESIVHARRWFAAR